MACPYFSQEKAKLRFPPPPVSDTWGPGRILTVGRGWGAALLRAPAGMSLAGGTGVPGPCFPCGVPWSRGKVTPTQTGQRASSDTTQAREQSTPLFWGQGGRLGSPCGL